MAKIIRRAIPTGATDEFITPPPPLLYQFMVTCIENWSVRSFGQWITKSKVYLLIIHARTEKRFNIAIMFLGRRRSSREE